MIELIWPSENNYGTIKKKIIPQRITPEIAILDSLTPNLTTLS